MTRLVSNQSVVPSSFLASVSAALILISLLATGMAACSRKIGDACTTSADCDPSRGTRTCDLSQPGGYCVVEGCDARSCPEDSFCVRFFPTAYATQACAATCSPGPCDPALTCAPDAECVGEGDDAFCVRRSLEKRVCVQVCSANDDCRGGYVCATTGTNGAVALTLSSGDRPKFCRPAP